MPDDRQRYDSGYEAQLDAPVAVAPGQGDFETLLRELQQVVDDLDGTSLSLEASIQAYERAAQLAAACQRMLDAAELRVTTIDEEMRRLAEEATPYTAPMSGMTGIERARALLLGVDDEEDDLSDLLDDED